MQLGPARQQRRGVPAAQPRAGDRRGRVEQARAGAAAGEVPFAPAGEHGRAPAHRLLGLRGRSENQRSTSSTQSRRNSPRCAPHASAGRRPELTEATRCRKRARRPEPRHQRRAGRPGRAHATQKFRDAQRKLQDIDRSLAQRTARLRLLQQLQEKWEGFGEGAKAVLQGRLSRLLASRSSPRSRRGWKSAPSTPRRSRRCSAPRSRPSPSPISARRRRSLASSRPTRSAACACRLPA